MACDPQIFCNFTRAQFDALVAKAETSGVTISSDAGETKARGVTVCWEFIEREATLTITVIGKPFYIPCSTLIAKIQSWVDSPT